MSSMLYMHDSCHAGHVTLCTGTQNRKRRTIQKTDGDET